MRISDWSSDVCSSDLEAIWCLTLRYVQRRQAASQRSQGGPQMSLEQITQSMSQRVSPGSLDATVKFDFGDDGIVFVDGAAGTVSNEDAEADCTITLSMDNFKAMEIGRAECRERVCQYV